LDNTCQLYHSTCCQFGCMSYSRSTGTDWATLTLAAAGMQLQLLMTQHCNSTPPLPHTHTHTSTLSVDTHRAVRHQRPRAPNCPLPHMPPADTRSACMRVAPYSIQPAAQQQRSGCIHGVARHSHGARDMTDSPCSTGPALSSIIAATGQPFPAPPGGYLPAPNTILGTAAGATMYCC
jgi:hypothetical protein